jgi:hypothetical protein
MLYFNCQEDKRQKKGVIKMIKVFIPEKKGKNKTAIRGFWYSKENKKTYYDYLSIQEFKEFPSYRCIENLRIKYNQEAIAIIGYYQVLNVFYKNRQEIFPHRIFKEVLRQDLKKAIKEALRQYSGLTVYNEAGRYYIEIFTTI